MKLPKDELEILDSYERGSLHTSVPNKTLLKKLSAAAESTFRKDRRINIRLSDHDMVGIQRVAAVKGVPYQSLISGLIHQFIEGELVPRNTVEQDAAANP